MADAFLTTSEVAKFNDSDLDIGILSEVLNDAPVLAAIAAKSIAGVTYNYLKETAAPNVGFRSENAGRENSVGQYTKVAVDLKILDASYYLDIAVAEADERGASAALATQAVSHLRSAMFHAEKEIINGDQTGGFGGFADQISALSNSMCVNAGGSTADTGSSVYAVVSSPAEVSVVWGQSGEINVGDTVVQKHDATTGSYPVYYTPISAYCGLQVGTDYSLGAIRNITEDSSAKLTDDMIADLLSKFPAGKRPSMLVMNRRSLAQLRDSRVASHPTGAPVPFPSDSFGVPIVVSDAVGSAEALIS
jgi:hypothetical protein